MGEQPKWRLSATHSLHAVLLLKAEIEEGLQSQIGINLADNEALLHLDAADGPLKMTDIAERLVLSKAGTTKVIDRLEQAGLADRVLDSSDRRVVLARISPAGSAMLKRSRAVVDEALERLWKQHLTSDEMATILEAMKRLLHSNSGWL